MKQKYTIGFIALVLTIALAGCVHDYPGMTEEGEEGVDPTLVEVNTEVTLDLELVPLEIITQESARSGTNKARNITTKADDGYRRRFIIEAWREGKPTTRQVTVMETAALDLRQYRDEWNARVQVSVDMVRPLAKYELIATDVKDFLRKTKKQRAGDETFTITFSYGFYLPTVFNVLAGKPADSRTGIAYTTPLAVPADGREECAIGTDFVFVNGTESFVSLSMEIRDSGGNVISRTTGLKVPYRRGHLTTVRARFLTNEMQGGVDIDDEFEGDIDIDLDGLLH